VKQEVPKREKEGQKVKCPSYVSVTNKKSLTIC